MKTITLTAAEEKMIIDALKQHRNGMKMCAKLDTSKTKRASYRIKTKKAEALLKKLGFEFKSRTR